MANQTLAQIYVANPVATLAGTEYVYLGQTAGTVDAGALSAAFSLPNLLGLSATSTVPIKDATNAWVTGGIAVVSNAATASTIVGRDASGDTVLRNLTLAAAGVLSFTGRSQVQSTADGTIDLFAADGATRSAVSAGRYVGTGGTIAANAPILDLTQTFNNAGVSFFGIDYTATNTASAAGSRLLRLRVGAATAFDVNTAGSISFPGSLSMGAGSTNPQANLNGGTLTGTTSTPPLSVSQTWNNASGVFTGILSNITNTASDATSKLLDLQVGGSSRSLNVLVGTSGRVLTLDGAVTSNSTYAGNNYAFIVSTTTASMAMYGSVGLSLPSSYAVVWSSTSAYNGTSDIQLQRDAAGALAQRRNTTAQVLRVYQTYTDASNYERLGFNQAAGYVEVAAETAGTGTDDRNVRLTPAGTGNVIVSPATATPAAGSVSARLLFGTTAGFGIYYGSGAPTVSAAQGSIYLRSDGSGTADRLYVNTTGSTTWTNFVSAT
jgi:hypothetical protein